MLIDAESIKELKEYIHWRKNFYFYARRLTPKPEWLEPGIDYAHGYLHELLELKELLAAPISPTPRHLSSSQSPPSASNRR